MGMRGCAVKVDRESPSENMAQSLRAKKKMRKDEPQRRTFLAGRTVYTKTHRLEEAL